MQMYLRRLISLIAVAPAVATCAPSVNLDSQVVDWSSTTPSEFLDLLRRHPESALFVHQAPDSWIRPSDLPNLFSQLDSTEQCAAVVSYDSSRLLVERSTVGAEAAFLISGYRRGRYPPSLSSDRPVDTPEELRSWWSGSERESP